MPVPAIFFDRSGTLIEDKNGPITNPASIHWLPGAIDAIELAQSKGFITIIISNQPWIAKGLTTADAVDEIHKAMQDELEKFGVKRITQTYYCPHAVEDNCNCRKPKAGLIVQAVKDHRIDLSKSMLVGDREKDIQLARKVGCKSYLVLTGHGEKTLKKIGGEKSALIDGVYKNVLEAVRNFQFVGE